MPVTDLPSYLPTMDEFIAHWAGVNAFLEDQAREALVLRDGSTLADFARLRDELVPALQQFEQAVVLQKQVARERETLRKRRELLQEEVLLRIGQFAEEILCRTPDNAPLAGWVQSLLALTPRQRALAQMDRVAQFWKRAEEATPFVLTSGYTRAEYCETIRRFREAGRHYRNFCKEHRLPNLGGLGSSFVQAMEWMTWYRCAVRFEVVVEREFLRTLPARTPYSYCPR